MNWEPYAIAAVTVVGIASLLIHVAGRFDPALYVTFNTLIGG